MGERYEIKDGKITEQGVQVASYRLHPRKPICRVFVFSHKLVDRVNLGKQFASLFNVNSVSYFYNR